MGKFKPPKPKKSNFLKTETSSQPRSWDTEPPAFSFEKMQDGSGHSLNCCQDEDCLHLVKRIFMLSRTEWRIIRQASRKGLGSEKIARNAISHAVPPSVTEDVQSFLALHYQGKKRFVGYKVDKVFFILWIDHNFKVYDHGS